jgi:hypothetical protein
LATSSPPIHYRHYSETLQATGILTRFRPDLGPCTAGRTEYGPIMFLEGIDIVKTGIGW